MSTIDLRPLYRTSVGFDQLASLLDSAFRAESSTNSYPPYNIEVLEENRYAITIAVAGFTNAELDVQVENGVLTVRGKKDSAPEQNFLHRGIAYRSFERRFNLADHVEVTGADLEHGILTVSLVKQVPEAMKPRSIAINAVANALEQDDRAA